MNKREIIGAGGNGMEVKELMKELGREMTKENAENYNNQVEQLTGEAIAQAMNQQMFGDDIPQDFKDRIKATMKKESPKVKGSLPKYMYHGTSRENVKSIQENGLKAHDLYGQVYLCKTREDVLLFMKGQPCSVFEVDTTRLLRKRFRVSLDHNKHVYPCEAFAYYGDIPPHALMGYKNEGAGE